MNDLIAGKEFDFGTTILSEEEIIAFAQQWDPIPFHIDREAAAKSIFKGIVASGPHLFMATHRREWISRFKDTLVAGMGIDKWRLIKPVYAGMPVHCKVKIVKVEPAKSGKTQKVLWSYLFTDDKGETVQTLEMTVLHKVRTDFLLRNAK